MSTSTSGLQVLGRGGGTIAAGQGMVMFLLLDGQQRRMMPVELLSDGGWRFGGSEGQFTRNALRSLANLGRPLRNRGGDCRGRHLLSSPFFTLPFFSFAIAIASLPLQ